MSKEIKNPDNIAVVYARYSSHNQSEQSIEGQLDAAYKYADEKGYSIISEYIDRAKSGRNDNRESFQKMLKDTEKHKFSVIIVWKVDRFGRNREEITINKARCRRNGVRIEYVAEAIPDTDEGVVLESVLEGFAEYYSLQLSRNIRRGQKESAEKCQSIGGGTPLGYKIGEDKKFILDPQGAETVRMIFRLYADGQSIFQVIDHLNDLGLRTSKGKPFTKNSLSTILKNEKYRGIYIYKDMRIEGGMPRIIDDATFFKVQEMLKHNKRAPSNKWSAADYLLTGKLFCGKCGGAMVGESGTSHNGTKHYYYTCMGKRREKKCNKKSVGKDFIENLVIRHALTLIADDEVIDHITDATWKYYQEQNIDFAEVKALKSELREAEKSSANLLKAIEQGLPFNENVRMRINSLEEQAKSLKAAIAEKELSGNLPLQKEHIKYFLQSLRFIDENNIESKKRLIKTFINSVFVFDDHIRINYNLGRNSDAIALEDALKIQYKKVRIPFANLDHIVATDFVSFVATFVCNFVKSHPSRTPSRLLFPKCFAVQNIPGTLFLQVPYRLRRLSWLCSRP